MREFIKTFYSYSTSGVYSTLSLLWEFLFVCFVLFCFVLCIPMQYCWIYSNHSQGSHLWYELSLFCLLTILFISNSWFLLVCVPVAHFPFISALICWDLTLSSAFLFVCFVLFSFSPAFLHFWRFWKFRFYFKFSKWLLYIFQIHSVIFIFLIVRIKFKMGSFSSFFFSFLFFFIPIQY